MAQATWQIILVAPGEDEVVLLADLSRRRDATVIAVVDPPGDSIGGAIAEVMGIPVVAQLTAHHCADAEYLVYPDGYQDIASLQEQGAQHQMRTIASSELRKLMQAGALQQRTISHPLRDLEFLERETESIHRTLSRIEEALERESLLRWLLSLATRAVQATSGSIMLLDEGTQELYVAFAYGLSENTMHMARVKLGEGIAGRVAQTRVAELRQGRDVDARTAGRTERVDRPDILGAISAPLVWGNRLLGVLNVNVSIGDRLLTEDDLEIINGLSHRLGMILERFLWIQDVQKGELFRTVDKHLQELAAGTDDLPTILAAWAGCLALEVGAERLSVAVVCDDGNLLVGEGTHGGDTSAWYTSLENPAWREVFETGSPLVVREEAPTSVTDTGLTVYYLPIGKDPLEAVLSVSFTSSAEAHQFPVFSGEILYVLEKRLAHLVADVRQRSHLERMSRLAGVLAEHAATSGRSREQRLARIRTAALQLTGAEQAFLVTGVRDGRAELVGDDVLDSSFWQGEAGRLLADAQDDQWRVTMVAGETGGTEHARSLLAVTAQAGAAEPGIILIGKNRLHPFDGEVFTRDDAEVALRLAALLAGGDQEPGLEEQVLRMDGRPEPAPTELSTTASVATDSPPSVSPSRELLIEVLRREMDRCDRYHTVFALALFRPQPIPEMGPDAAATLAAGLARRIRSSDYICPLPSGEIAVIAPEDVQALSRLQRRVVGLVHELTGVADLPVATSQTVYPGRHDNPDKLLDDTLAALA